MGHIGKFEELIAWQKARELTRAVYDLTRCERFGKNFGLSSQIQRAAVSIMSNVAEGFERDNRGDFHRFLSIAKGSCAEVRSQLYITLDIGYLNPNEFQKLNSQTEEVARIIGGLRASVEKQRQKL